MGKNEEVEELVQAVRSASGIEEWRSVQFHGKETPRIVLDTLFLFPDRVGQGAHKEPYASLVDGLEAFNKKHGIFYDREKENDIYLKNIKNTIHQYDYDSSGGHVDSKGSMIIVEGETMEDLKNVVSKITGDPLGFCGIMREMLSKMPKENCSRKAPVMQISGGRGATFDGKINKSPDYVKVF